MYQEPQKNTPKWISFQRALSSMCNLHQGEKVDHMEIAKMAHDVNEYLYACYPLDEATPKKEFHQTLQTKQVEGVKICEVPNCGHPMIRQYNKKNPKSPDWKCSDKNCKFTKQRYGGWVKSEYITGAWDESEEDKKSVVKSMQRDADLELIEEDNYNSKLQEGAEW